MKTLLILSLLIPIALASSSVDYHYETLISDHDNSTFKFPVFDNVEEGEYVARATICEKNECFAYRHYTIREWR